MLDANTNSTGTPGGTIRYHLTANNIGEGAADGSAGDPVLFTASLPPEVSATDVVFEFPPFGTFPWNHPFIGYTCSGDGPGEAPNIIGAHHLDCSVSTTVEAHELKSSSGVPLKPVIVAKVDEGTSLGTELEAGFTLSGAGAGAVSTHEVTHITDGAPAFGIDQFDTSITADAAGTPSNAAGAHPYATSTPIDFNTLTNSNPLIGDSWPVAAPKDIEVDLPPGFVGNPLAAERCDAGELATTQCPPESQVGTVVLRLNGITANNLWGPLPLWNIIPPPGTPALFGFNIFGVVTTLDAHVRSDGDYGVTVRALSASEGIAFSGSTTTFWGVPSDESHTPERSCGGGYPWYAPNWAPPCTSAAPPLPFLRNSSACTEPGEGLPFSLRTDSWKDPATTATAAIRTHAAPGYPRAPENWGPEQGIDGCAEVPFDPSIEASPTTNAAASPSGLDFRLSLPQECWQSAAEICSSDLRDATLTLPQGVTLNPSSAAALGACSPAQVGLITPVGQDTPIHFDESPVTCPTDSKLGSVEITTPLLEAPLTGSVYLAQQTQNPFGSLLGIYLVAAGSGVVIKQAGEIETGAGGQLTTRFLGAPQQPFSELHVSLFGGARAPLRTPPACGTYTSHASLSPWSGNEAAELDSSFAITQGPSGTLCPTAAFDPHLSAGTQNPLAGSYSPFSLRLTRDDGTQEIAKLGVTLPKGLIGAPKGIAYCPDSVLASFPAETVLGSGAAQEANSRCPAASQLGTVTAGAGAGPTPFYTGSGRAYLAGPYKGAPLSIAVLTPAVAGPFDLGTVLVRNAVHVDPETAQISVASDPLPTALHGIPLDLRDIRADLNRPNFTLNPTSCEPAAIAATVTSAQGATANPSSHFQAADCDRLGFKPKLSLKLKGGTKRSDHPALTAVLRARKGDANIGRVQVALPHSEFLAQSHIRTICTRVQFAADQCPAGSIYGKVTASSPILDYPLSGDVYLRSSSNPLPDMVLKLKGPPSQPIEVDAVGRIDSKNGGIRTTFQTVPDAPLSKVVVKLPAGRKSLLENSTNICSSANKATVQMTGQNGKVSDSSTTLQARCPKHGKRARHGARGR